MVSKGYRTEPSNCDFEDQIRGYPAVLASYHHMVRLTHFPHMIFQAPRRGSYLHRYPRLPHQAMIKLFLHSNIPGISLWFMQSKSIQSTRGVLRRKWRVATSKIECDRKRMALQLNVLRHSRIPRHKTEPHILASLPRRHDGDNFELVRPMFQEHA